jgi:ribulose-5-phosphate 4-epimerase/fuculose-1-phosphate aldolase
LVAPDGRLAEGNGIVNVAGYYIHWPILQARPDLVSAVHVHIPRNVVSSSPSRKNLAFSLRTMPFLMMKRSKFKAWRQDQGLQLAWEKTAVSS